MFQEFIDYMLYWIEPGEFILAFIGLIFIIVLWIAGGIYEKEQKNEAKKGE